MFYTTAQVVALTGSTSERVKFWAGGGKLIEPHNDSPGTGHHRRYALNAVFAAAIFNRLTDVGLHAAAHRRVLPVLPVIMQRRPLGEPLLLCISADGAWLADSDGVVLRDTDCVFCLELKSLFDPIEKSLRE